MDQREGGAIATPMSHRLLPYFTELLGDFSTHGVDNWGYLRWMRLAFGKGPRYGLNLFRVYFGAMWDLLRQSGRKRADKLSQVAPIHEERLEALSKESGYGLPTLRALASLRAMPAEYSMLTMARVFYFDRFVIIFGMLMAVLVAVLIGGSAGWTLGLGSSVAGLLLMRFLAKSRVSHLEEQLRESASKIADAEFHMANAAAFIELGLYTDAVNAYEAAWDAATKA